MSNDFIQNTEVIMQKEFMQHNLNCKSETHDKHLCYLVSQGFHISDSEEFKVLTDNPNFQCKHCGRHANINENLCEPENL